MGKLTGIELRGWIYKLRYGQQSKAQLARGTVYSFVAKMLGLAAGFAMQLVMARMIGATDLGIYYYALGWVTIISNLACLGFNFALVKYVAVFLARDDLASLRGILIRSSQFCLAASVIGMALIWGWWLISKPHWAIDMKVSLLLGSFLIPMFTFNVLRQATLRGMKKVFQFQALDSILRPVLILIGVLIWPYFMRPSISAEHVMMIQIAATALVLLAGIVLVKSQLPAGFRTIRPQFDSRGWLRTAMPLYATTVMRVITLQAGLLIIGTFLPAQEAGVYSVILRLADLVVFGVGLVDAIAAPMIAELYHAGKFDELQLLVQRATRITFAVATCAALGLYAFGDWILGLYGEDFTTGLHAMGIIMFAYLLQALVGPVGYMISMTGQENRLIAIQGVSMIVNLGLGFLLTPWFGIEGAAVALAVSTVVWQGWMFVFVKRNFGIRSMPF